MNETFSIKRSRIIAFALLVCTIIWKVEAWASPGSSNPSQPDPAGLCESAAAIAAVEHGIPQALFLAISQVETGRATSAGPGRPWPWAINARGEGHWFATRRAAVDFAERAEAMGAEQIDVGCFQINERWHGDAFEGFSHMVDPTANARYAARFLAALYREFGDWTAATAAYHSRTHEKGRAYVTRVRQALRAPVSAEPHGTATLRTAAKRQLYRRPPLPSSPGALRRAPLGSLVPLASIAAPRPLADGRR